MVSLASWTNTKFIKSALDSNMTEMIKQTDSNSWLKHNYLIIFSYHIVFSNVFCFTNNPEISQNVPDSVVMTQLESGNVWFSRLKNDLKD